MSGDEIDREAADRILRRIGRDDEIHEEVAEEIAVLIRDYTAARGIDVWAVDYVGKTAAEWAEMTGRDRSTVARNVRRATGEVTE